MKTLGLWIAILSFGVSAYAEVAEVSDPSAAATAIATMRKAVAADNPNLAAYNEFDDMLKAKGFAPAVNERFAIELVNIGKANPVVYDVTFEISRQYQGPVVKNLAGRMVRRMATAILHGHALKLCNNDESQCTLRQVTFSGAEISYLDMPSTGGGTSSAGGSGGT